MAFLEGIEVKLFHCDIEAAEDSSKTEGSCRATIPKISEAVDRPCGVPTTPQCDGFCPC